MRPIVKRPFFVALMTTYCIVFWALLDFSYSSLFPEHGRLPRIASPIFHHTFATKFKGYDLWAEHSHMLYTNNLGFKDATVRDVPLVSSNHRVLLIGDSFTEGIGLPFENTFAGMLFAAGQRRSPQIEFLNAGVASYSPSIHYKKVTHYFDQGLRFDDSLSCLTCLTSTMRQANTFASMQTQNIALIVVRMTGIMRTTVFVSPTGSKSVLS
jgi:hypothetical protein